MTNISSYHFCLACKDLKQRRKKRLSFLYLTAILVMLSQMAYALKPITDPDGPIKDGQIKYKIIVNQDNDLCNHILSIYNEMSSGPGDWGVPIWEDNPSAHFESAGLKVVDRAKDFPKYGNGIFINIHFPTEKSSSIFDELDHIVEGKTETWLFELKPNYTLNKTGQIPFVKFANSKTSSGWRAEPDPEIMSTFELDPGQSRTDLKHRLTLWPLSDKLKAEQAAGTDIYKKYNLYGGVGAQRVFQYKGSYVFTSRIPFIVAGSLTTSIIAIYTLNSVTSVTDKCYLLLAPTDYSASLEN